MSCRGHEKGLSHRGCADGLLGSTFVALGVVGSYAAPAGARHHTAVPRWWTHVDHAGQAPPDGDGAARHLHGSMDLTTGELVGNLVLPPATTTVSLAGLGLATATFDLAPVGPVQGTVTSPPWP